MITAKTESGFSIELEDDALEDQELFDAISGMQDGNVFSMSHLTERLLHGFEQEAVDGRVGQRSVGAALDLREAVQGGDVPVRDKGCGHAANLQGSRGRVKRAIVQRYLPPNGPKWLQNRPCSPMTCRQQQP